MAPRKHPPDILAIGDVVLNQADQEVTVNGTTHHLTPKECRLLATFMQHPGEVLTRAFLMQEVWDTEFTEDTRTIEVHVSWLRKKIEKDSSSPRYILTIRGVGYIFEQQ